MRIISKYKDYYDYVTQDNDADITWVRQPRAVYEPYDALFSPKDTFSRASRFVPYRRSFWDKHEPNTATLSSFIFGIYPYVYSQPILELNLKAFTEADYQFQMPLSKAIIDACIGKKDEEQEKILLNEALKFMKATLKDKKYIKIPKSLKMKMIYLIEAYYWKVECKEIFEKMDAPTFFKYDDRAVDLIVYKIDGYDPHKSLKYIANVCFSQLSTLVTKAWMDEIVDLNTYINIENFLWSRKKEPTSEPTNETKIVNHGFDLKTSFRKM